MALSETWSRISAGLGARLDAFVPPDMAPGSDEASRARIAAGVSFVLSLSRTAGACVHFAAGSTGQAWINVALALVTGTAPFAMRRAGRYPLVLNGALAASVAAMTVSAVTYHSQGIDSASVALAAIPLIATFLGGVRVGAAWTAISSALSMSVAFWGDEWMGRPRAPDRLRDHAVMVLITAVLFLVAVLYERGRARQLAHIADLEARRHATELEQVHVLADARIAQAEHLASVGRIAEAVAHEMNNPLAYILSNLEFLSGRLERDGVQADVREAIVDAMDGARRLERIVAELFQFMRPVHATASNAGDVAEAVRAALEIAASRLRDKATVHVELGEVPLVRGDTLRLTHVLLNLVVHVAQAMPEGPVAGNRIQIRAAVEHGRVRVEVESTAEKHGPDLGLALAHTILEAVDGRLEFESHPGRAISRVWLAVASETPSVRAPD